MHRKRRTVLAHARHDTTDTDDAPFPGLQIAREIAVMAAAVRFRHQAADVSPDRFRRCIAELPLGGAAEKLNDAILVDDDHRIGHGIQNRTKVSLARPQGILKAFLIINVEDDAAEAGGLAIRTIHNSSQRPNPVASIGMPVYPVLSIKIASCIDRLLYRRRGAIAILQIEQRKKEVVVD